MLLSARLVAISQGYMQIIIRLLTGYKDQAAQGTQGGLLLCTTGMLLCIHQACQQQAVLMLVCLVSIRQGCHHITNSLPSGYYQFTIRLPGPGRPRNLRWSTPLHHSGVAVH